MSDDVKIEIIDTVRLKISTHSIIYVNERKNKSTFDECGNKIIIVSCRTENDTEIGSSFSKCVIRTKEIVNCLKAFIEEFLIFTIDDAKTEKNVLHKSQSANWKFFAISLPRF